MSPFTPKHPPFIVRGWRNQVVPAQDMVRHFLITGETGSGKSVSGVMPLLRSVLRYPEEEAFAQYSGPETREELRPSVLVIDPKGELAEVVEQEGRQIRTMAPVHLFEGLSLGAEKALDLILQQSDFFIQDQTRGDDPMWNQQAAFLIRDFMAADMWLAGRGLLKVFWSLLKDKLVEFEGSTAEPIAYDRDNYFRHINAILSLSGAERCIALSCYMHAAEAVKVPAELTSRIVNIIDLNHTTRSSVIWMCIGILADLCSEELAAKVSLNPIEPPEHFLSVKDVLNNGEVVVYSPTSNSTVADVIGRCFKTKFFQFAFTREAQTRPFFYIVDEAQRFLTSGREDGEQSLLDRCRAYRTGVVLASQSLSSMAYRLKDQMTPLQIIMNNCGNSLYFRTPDTNTQDALAKRIPPAPIQGRPHVLQVRPLTSLPVGSCYAMRASGDWSIDSIRLVG